MPTIGLAKFIRESEAIKVEGPELVAEGFRELVRFSFDRVVENSPTADPDAPGSGRLRASWTAAAGAPDYEFAPLPAAGGRIPAPRTPALADVDLGDEVFIANGSPCVSTVNDRTAFVDANIEATQAKAEEIAARLSNREISGARAIQRAKAA
ncbi:MAG TPA: hypothetical protein VFD92_04615 [Candidatus Binatia bacterium]|nr:hypothetical protein [Candidatus Binatia bacterium]